MFERKKCTGSIFTARVVSSRLRVFLSSPARAFRGVCITATRCGRQAQQRGVLPSERELGYFVGSHVFGGFYQRRHGRVCLVVAPTELAHGSVPPDVRLAVFRDAPAVTGARKNTHHT